MKEVIVDVVIPAYNEQDSIGKVLADIPPGLIREVVVVDNNSTDNTADVAKKGGATVLFEKQAGYGNACLKGIDYLTRKKKTPDILVFIDGDYSDYPEEILNVYEPLIKENFDLVIGSRALGSREKGSMTPQQLIGNWLATWLMKRLYGAQFTDLGPFRAIKFDKLLAIGMQDKSYGWTVEMQIKAVKHNLKYKEVEVKYRKRIGFSKVSGTVKGTLMAGIKIIYLIFKYV